MNILLNINNFGQEPFYSYLREIISPKMKVLIIPFSFHEEWIQNEKDFYKHYGYSGDEFKDIVKEFYPYHIRFRNIRVLNCFRDSHEDALRKIHQADILFFTGGYPAKLMYRLSKMGIIDAIREFPGIVMGTSAGAMVQFDRYHVTPEEEGEDYEYHYGVGRLSGFDIEVHYEESFPQLSCMLIALKEAGVPIYAMPNDSGLICDEDGDIHIMGEAFRVDLEDIDDIQERIDEMEEEARAMDDLRMVTDDLSVLESMEDYL